MTMVLVCRTGKKKKIYIYIYIYIYLTNKCVNELDNHQSLSLTVAKYSPPVIQCHCLFAAVCGDISRRVINLNTL